jgi:hypothetical protein
MFGMTWIIDNTIPEGSVEFRQDGRTVGRILINPVEPSKGEAAHVAE